MNTRRQGLDALSLFGAGALTLALLASGCKKETPPTDAPTATATEAAPAPAPSPVAQAEPPVDPSTIPTEEDFEDDAIKTISSKNLNEELDKLEKEIQKE